VRLALQIAAGEPLLLSYGPLSNDFLLMDYGFVIPDNPHDRVALRFDMNLVNVSAHGWGSSRVFAPTACSSRAGFLPVNMAASSRRADMHRFDLVLFTRLPVPACWQGQAPLLVFLTLSSFPIPAMR
jgi:hypothetical protein